MMDIPPYPNSLIKGLTHYLFSFFHEAKLNSYYGFDLSDNLKWNEKPKNAIFKHGRWVPENPDGVTIGNLQSFAAIGVPELTAESVYEYYSGNSEYFPRVLPSKMTLLVGPEKDIEHLKVLFNNVKFQDFYIAYNQGDFKNRRFTSLLSLDHVKIDRLLYRVNKTSVVCSFHNLPSISVKCVDFAPIIDNPQDPNQRLHLPAICRLVVVSNTSNEVLSDLQFGPVFVNFGSEWEINELVSTEIPELTQYLLVKEVENTSFRCYGRYGKNFYVSEEGEDYQDAKYFESLEKIDKSEPLSEIGFCAAPFTIEALKPGESITLPYLFLLSQNDNDAETILKQIKAFSQQEPDISLFQRFLNQTLKYGSIEHDFANITTSNPRLNDLVDSILSMMKIHVGSLGLHTGSVYYPHSSAFVRDNFMFQRALAKAGNLQAARLNVEFFYQSWRNSGIKNSYHVSRHSGAASSKEMRVEIPAQFILMVKNLVEWSHDESLVQKYYAMIKDCADIMLGCPNGLFILNSDEMWIWAAYCDELTYYLDTSVIMVAGIEYACQAAKILKQEEDLAAWVQKRDDWIRAFNKAFIILNEKRYATGLDNSGYQDQSIMTSCLSRPVLLDIGGVLNTPDSPYEHEELAYNSIYHAWQVLRSQPIVRSHSKTTAIIGNTPGLFLYACSALDMPFCHQVFKSVAKFSNCTGSVNEIHDLYNLAWGTERRRVGDSATILEGILHFLFGLKPSFDSFSFLPHVAESGGYALLSNFPLFNRNINIFACESMNLVDLLLKSESPGENFVGLFGRDIINRIVENYDRYPIVNKIFTLFSAKVLNLNQNDLDSLTFATDIQGNIKVYGDFQTIEFGIRPLSQNLPILTITQITGEDLHYQRLAERQIQDLLSNGMKEIFWVFDFHDQLIDHEFMLEKFDSFFVVCEYDEIDNSYLINVENVSKNWIICNMQGDTKLIEPFTANQFRKQKLDSPRNHHELLPRIPENVPEIPHFLLQLDDFFMHSHDANAVILFDQDSASHALQIVEILGILKAMIFPHHLLAPDSSLDDIKLLTAGKNLIVVSSKPLNNYYFASEFELISNYNGFKLYSTPISLRTNCILIENSGHVYDDTYQFCEYLGIYLQPCRDKAMSMHPYGKFRLADLLGEPPTAPFPLEITASQPINFYVQGRHINGQKYDSFFDPGKKTEIFKPLKPYCSFYTIAPYVPFEIGAGGIATGTNCIHFLGEMDADEPITVEFKMIFAQNMQPIQFIVGNRERILDPTTYEKLADGRKLLKIVMHPGRPLPKFVVNDENQAKKRSFGYTFGRYPHF